MTVSATSTISDYNQTYQASGTTSVRQQRKQDFADLAQALQAGDLGGAQQAFSALQQLMMPNAVSTTSQAQTVQPTNGVDSIGTDLNALTQSIQSGDQVKAQSDLAKLAQDLKSIGGKKHHHHHHASATPQSDASTVSGAGSSTQDAAKTTASSLSINFDQFLSALALIQPVTGSSAGSSGLNLIV